MLLRVLVFLFILIQLQANTTALANDKITLQLRGKHQFQFAGYYAAVEKGFYSEVGLDVTIQDLEKGVDAIDEVLAGNATYGIANSELLVRYMNGDPVVVLAPIFQSCPSAIVVRESSKILTPQDLTGRTLEIDTKNGDEEILAMLYMEGIKLSQINIVESTHSLNNLLNNKVDATSIYQTNEPFFLDKFGIPYRIISPKSYGIDFYAECLFTTRNELRRNSSRVKKFIAASIKGWEYALANPDEISRLIQTKYKSTKTLDHLLFEAEQIKNYIQPDFIDIGHSNKGRWLRMTEVLLQCGLINKTRDLDEFIYKYEQSGEVPIYKYFIIIGIAALVILAIVLFHVRTLKRLSKKRNKLLIQQEQKIEQQELLLEKVNNELLRYKHKSNELENFNESLLTNLSFEIRAPLNNILGYCELLNAPRLKTELTKQYTKEVTKSGRTLQHQIDNLIELSKIETKQNKLIYQRINLFDFLNTLQIITLNELKLFDKDYIAIKTSIDEEEINFDILSDRNILKNIFLRLISNAVKYTSKGYIELGCKKQNDTTLHLWIQDSGCGIDKQNVADLFIPFRSNINGNPTGNLGLGLPVVKGLTESLGGKVWIETVEKNGTTVNITIPITPVGTRSPKGSTVPYYLQQEPPDLKGKTILIVEDIQSNFLLLSKMLADTNCEILHSNSGADALEKFQSTPNIDLVFMDLRLSDTDGIEITRKIRRNNTNVIIVAQTAYSSGVKVNLSIEAGCNDFITKPISQLDLYNILRKYLSPKDAI